MGGEMAGKFIGEIVRGDACNEAGRLMGRGRNATTAEDFFNCLFEVLQDLLSANRC